MIQNFFSAKNFEFTINRLPNVEFFVQSTNIPGLTIATTEQSTPFSNIPRPGNKLQFDEFSVTVRLDENLLCYKEIYDWMVGMTNAKDYSQYANLQANGGIFSDASLIILNSKGNPVKEFKYQNIFPVGMTSVSLSTIESSTQYVTTTITFRYTVFDIVDF